MKKIQILLVIHFILGILTIIFFDGTGDAGDSIYHYLYAKYAPVNNELFFDHWAKPLYVLIASPFAQIGFIGVKIMNLLFVNATLYLTYLIAKKHDPQNAWIAPIILIFSPLYFILTFSGLTEPFFAFLLSFSLYLFFQKKIFWSCVMISLLPYVRSEGLFFIGIFGAYFLYFKKWKALLLLCSGSIIYSLSGFPFYNDLLWVFNKVPYAKMSSTYGSGDPFHFIEQLLYVTGVPIYILFWIGIVSWFNDLIRKNLTLNTTYFIYGSVFAFVLAHSVFWYYGIFNSMGLKRVLICILPLISIIALKGYNLIFAFPVQATVQKILKSLILVYIVVFPFTKNPAAIDFEHDLSLNTDQKLAQKVAIKIQELTQYPNSFRLISNHPYMCELLDVNCFSKTQKRFLNKNTLKELKTNDIIVWESWFSIIEHGLHKEQLDAHPKLKQVYNISEENHKGRTIEYALYVIN